MKRIFKLRFDPNIGADIRPAPTDKTNQDLPHRHVVRIISRRSRVEAIRLDESGAKLVATVLRAAGSRDKPAADRELIFRDLYRAHASREKFRW
jgi:hypothetical protein